LISGNGNTLNVTVESNQCAKMKETFEG